MKFSAAFVPSAVRAFLPCPLQYVAAIQSHVNGHEGKRAVCAILVELKLVKVKICLNKAKDRC